jgi:hypothetical protein
MISWPGEFQAIAVEVAYRALNNTQSKSNTSRPIKMTFHDAARITVTAKSSRKQQKRFAPRLSVRITTGYRQQEMRAGEGGKAGATETRRTAKSSGN